MDRTELITEICKVTGFKRSLNPIELGRITHAIDKYTEREIEKFNSNNKESKVNDMRTEKEIREILEKFGSITEDEMSKYFGVDHHIVESTLLWVVGDMDDIPMGLPDDIIDRRP